VPPGCSLGDAATLVDVSEMIELDEQEPRRLTTPSWRSGGASVRGSWRADCVGVWQLGAAPGCGSAPCAPTGRLQGQTGACVHHRCSPGVDGGDDLLGGDALQVGSGRGRVGVAELALDQRQRDPLVQQLHSMGMAQLMRGQARGHPAAVAVRCSLRRGALADQAWPRVGPAITQNSGPRGSFARSVSHGCSTDHRRGPCRPRAGDRLSVPDQDRPAALVEVGFGQRQGLVDPQPGAPEHDDQAIESVTVAAVMRLAHHGDDFLDGRWVSGVALALVPWCLAGAEPRQRGGRACRPAASMSG
jgi:hypothetical protein